MKNLQFKEDPKAISLRFVKRDIAAIVLVLIMIAGVFMVFDPADDADAAVVEIYLNGEMIRRERLDTDMEFTVTGEYENTVRISGGRASIIESNCPGRDCVHIDPIAYVGRSIVCLPNRLEIRIAGETRGDVDFIVG